MPHARKIIQISALAVAIPKAAEDAEHLDVPLQTHQVEPAPPELRIDPCIQYSGFAQSLPVRFSPSINLRVIPRDIAIAQQRDQIVRERALQRVLEVHQARALSGHDQQIAAVEIAKQEG